MKLHRMVVVDFDDIADNLPEDAIDFVIEAGMFSSEDVEWDAFILGIDDFIDHVNRGVADGVLDEDSQAAILAELDQLPEEATHIGYRGTYNP